MNSIYAGGRKVRLPAFDLPVNEGKVAISTAVSDRNKRECLPPLHFFSLSAILKKTGKFNFVVR